MSIQSIPTPSSIKAPKAGLPPAPAGFSWRLTANPKVEEGVLTLTLSLFSNPSNQWSTEVTVDCDDYLRRSDDQWGQLLSENLLSAADDLLAAQRLHQIAARYVHPTISNPPKHETRTTTVPSLASIKKEA